MRRLFVLLAGRGKVGTSFARQLAEARQRLRQEGLDLLLCGVAGRGAFAVEPRGFEAESWRGRFEPCSGASVRHALDALDAIGPLVLVDATAEAAMGGIYLQAVERGVHIASCNKIPFSVAQKDYDLLMEHAARRGLYVRHESTVGAGLPTLGTLRNLRQSGDGIEEVSGCFSGTLNLLCAGLDAGQPFSKLLASARRNGFTEPDPREDLSGRDVARKALILARIAGGRMEPDGVRCQPLVRTDDTIPVERFMGSLEPYDRELGERTRDASRAGRALRYVARASPREASCELAEVERADPLARLTGPENIFVYRTRRYTVPLVVSGPGAGPEVTAAGLFADVLEVAQGAAGRVSREGQP